MEYIPSILVPLRLFLYMNFDFSRNYVVEKRDKSSGDWVRCAEAVNGTEVTIGKLKEGHEYEFRVMAENLNGLSEPLVTEKGVLVKNPFSMFSVLLFCCF